ALVAPRRPFVAFELAALPPRRTLRVMTKRSPMETATWCALALAGGCATGWYDLSASAVQAPALLLMLVTFALTLAGRAPVVPVSLLSAIGIPLMHALQAHDVNPGLIIVVIPAFIGALG